MISRYFSPLERLKTSSHFLLGPRAVGKSALIKSCLKTAAWRKRADYIDLLDSKVYLRLKSDPSLLGSLAKQKFVIIDEIQRIPELLNEAHRLIESGGRRFLLTGSSARKLKGGKANLLAGRAFMSRLFPLTWRELESAGRFQLSRHLRLGGLPLACLGKNGEEYLYNYVDTYLKSEIQEEALVRSLPNYTRFLQSAAINSSRLLNYAKTAADAGLSPGAVRGYYQILEDTLLGFSVPPWTKSLKRKAIQTAKFYFFDAGVARALWEIQDAELAGDFFGRAFEQFIAGELRACLSYRKSRLPLRYWRSKSGFEADFIIGDETAIEVKAGRKAGPRDHKGLLALKEEKAWKRLLLVSRDPLEMKFPSGVRQLHWKAFLTELWEGRFF